MKKQLFTLSFLLIGYLSFGAGYQINLEGLRQMAMGGTGTAIPWDVSTIFYNPAGLVRLKNIEAYASMAAVMPVTGFSNSNSSAQSISQTFVPINFYFGGPVRQGSNWALGLGIYCPAGTGLQWDNNWTGRYLVQNSQLKTFFLQPTISYKVGELVFLRRLWNLSVGAGFVYANGTYDLNQALPLQGYMGTEVYDATAKLHGNGVGVGFNTGIHLKYGDAISLGLTYRSQVNMNIDGGSAKFNVPTSLSTYFPNSSFTSLLPIPQVATFGLGIKFSESFALQLECNYTGWNSFDTLRINYLTHTSLLKDSRAPRHYQNTFTPRIGANCKIARGIAVMAGFAYDPTPVADGFVSPDLPDANRVILTCGTSIKLFPGFTMIAAFESTSSIKRLGSYNYGQFSGTYQTMVATPAIGFYYVF